MAEISRLEHRHPEMSPGWTRALVEIWRRFVRTPHHRLWEEGDGGCGVWECCGDPHEARVMLEAVAYRMSSRRAREFRALLRGLDDLY